jgi:deoxyribodipyrimidine photo-lyase
VVLQLGDPWHFDVGDRAILQRHLGDLEGLREGQCERAQIAFDILLCACAEIGRQRPICGTDHKRRVQRDDKRGANESLGPELKLKRQRFDLSKGRKILKIRLTLFIPLNLPVRRTTGLSAAGDRKTPAGMPASPVIVWFRDSLRLADHPALHAAAPLICLHVFDEQSPGLRPLGGATRWWLAQSLRSLKASLQAIGSDLVLRRGAAADVIRTLARETNARSVFWNDIAQGPHRAIAETVAAELAAIGVESNSFAGDLLVDPAALRSKDGRALRVFTPFWKRVLALGAPPRPLPAPTSLPRIADVAGLTIEELDLEPIRPDWAGGLRATWQAGERAAREQLTTFLEGAVQSYAGDRDRPDLDATSRLSPHLRFGEISPRQVWHAARFTAAAHPAASVGIDKYLSELGWREFSRHLLYNRPDLATRNLQPSFDAFPWKQDDAALKAWQRGRTGYPIVDAGLRELWHTGVMHNRVRMVAASFLVKHLLIDWRAGERWFWDTLVDADPGSNPASWQWVAGCGADAAPYFRVFNPVLQGEKFDSDGTYVRRWVGELAGLPVPLIHRPWSATPLELAGAGITLGRTYPAPIIDHRLARERALAAYRSLRKARIPARRFDSAKNPAIVGNCFNHRGTDMDDTPLIEQATDALSAAAEATKEAAQAVVTKVKRATKKVTKKAAPKRAAKAKKVATKTSAKKATKKAAKKTVKKATKKTPKKAAKKKAKKAKR